MAAHSEVFLLEGHLYLANTTLVAGLATTE